MSTYSRSIGDHSRATSFHIGTSTTASRYASGDWAADDAPEMYPSAAPDYPAAYVGEHLEQSQHHQHHHHQHHHHQQAHQTATLQQSAHVGAFIGSAVAPGGVVLGAQRGGGGGSRSSDASTDTQRIVQEAEALIDSFPATPARDGGMSYAAPKDTNRTVTISSWIEFSGTLGEFARDKAATKWRLDTRAISRSVSSALLHRYLGSLRRGEPFNDDLFRSFVSDALANRRVRFVMKEGRVCSRLGTLPMGATVWVKGFDAGVSSEGTARAADGVYVTDTNGQFLEAKTKLQRARDWESIVRDMDDLDSIDIVNLDSVIYPNPGSSGESYLAVNSGLYNYVRRNATRFNLTPEQLDDPANIVDRQIKITNALADDIRRDVGAKIRGLGLRRSVSARLRRADGEAWDSEAGLEYSAADDGVDSVLRLPSAVLTQRHRVVLHMELEFAVFVL